MPEPDIIIPISASGDEAWCYVDYSAQDRSGTKPLITDAGTEDKWRVHCNVRAVLARNGQAVIDTNGREIEIPSPLPSRTYDAADLIHDDQFRVAIPLMRTLYIRMARGDLKPLPTDEPVDTAPSAVETQP